MAVPKKVTIDCGEMTYLHVDRYDEKYKAKNFSLVNNKKMLRKLCFIFICIRRQQCIVLQFNSRFHRLFYHQFSHLWLWNIQSNRVYFNVLSESNCGSDNFDDLCMNAIYSFQTLAWFQVAVEKFMHINIQLFCMRVDCLNGENGVLVFF